VRGWRGGFFFKAIFGVESGLSIQVLLGRGRGEIYFPFSQWEGPRCLASIPFKFWGGEKGFFSISPYFPMCSQGVPFKFLMGSQYVLH